jgi:hypothetical protein
MTAGACDGFQPATTISSLGRPVRRGRELSGSSGAVSGNGFHGDDVQGTSTGEACDGTDSCGGPALA